MRRKARLNGMFSILICFVIGSILFLGGCSILTPKQSVMRTNIAKVSTRKTSKPVVISSKDGELLAVGQEEETSSDVEYNKQTPVTKGRSLWSRWWFWGLILVGITYFGLWPLVISFARKLRRKTHALVSVVKQIDVFKDKVKVDPRANDVEELKTILKAQDPVTKGEVNKVRNGR